MSKEQTIDLLHRLHGICMWVGMGLLVPIGIFGAKYKKIFKSHWYNIHAIAQRLAITLITAGFTIAVVFVTLDDNVDHFSAPHQIGGLIVFILMFMQGIGGTLRPAESVGDGIKSGKRRFWERGHTFMGYITWLLGQLVIFIGLYNYIDKRLGLAHIGWFVLVIIVYLLFLFKTYTDYKGREYFFKDDQESVDMTAKLSTNNGKQNYS